MINKIFTNIVAAVEKPKGLPTAELSTSTLNRVLTYVFVVAGSISIIMILIGSFRYVISRGDPAAIKTSKDTILYSIIGLMVSIFGYSMVVFVIGRVQ